MKAYLIATLPVVTAATLFAADRNPAVPQAQPEASPQSGVSAGSFGNCPEALRRLALNSGQSIFEGKHLWVRGASATVNPDVKDPVGINALISPPFAARCPLLFRVNGQPVRLDCYEWRVGEILRSGTVGDVRVESLLAPASVGRGTLLVVRLFNSGVAAATFAASLEMETPLLSQSSLWTYAFPQPKTKAELVVESDAKQMILTNNSGAVVLATDLAGVVRTDKKWTMRFHLDPGETARFHVALAVGPRAEACRDAERLLAQPEEQIVRARVYWNDQIEGLYARLPRLKSDNRRLVAFYERSLLSVPLARWELPGLLHLPFYATSGIDGGAFCAYIWDYAYAAQITPLCDPAASRTHLVQFLKSKPMEHYAFSPFDGTAIGPHYSYNQYSIIRGIYYYVLHTGDFAFLAENVDGKTVLDHLVAQALFKDDIEAPVALIDYGSNTNLLELKRTEAYTGFVPSPNAERCWSYRAVDRLAALVGKPAPNLSKRADELARLVNGQLWNSKQGWFSGIARDQLSSQTAYSIQIFDLLRLDILDEVKQKAIIAHLNMDEFLSEFGVHSLSKRDPGYDPSDVDWGGPGIYTGDAPELIQDLYHSGHPRPAGDLLGRILWWGERMPYYPQAVRADTIDYRRDGRSNVQSGIGAAQTLIFGVLGLEVALDGTVSIRPHLPLATHTLTFEGVRIRGQRFDATLDPGGCTVTRANGKKLQTALGQRLAILD